MEAIAIELGDPSDKKDWPKYVSAKKPAHDLKLKEAVENKKRSLKHSDQVKRCLDCLALLGGISNASLMQKLLSQREIITAVS